MKTNLTEQSVKAARARDKRVTLSDRSLPGLYLIVEPRSQRKSWVCQAVNRRTGKQQRSTISHWPETAVLDARRKAVEWLRMVRDDGVDPSEAVRAERTAGTTVREAVQELIDRAGSDHTKRLYRQLFRWAKPHMDRTCRDFSRDRASWSTLHSELSTRNGPAAADLCVRVLAAAMRRQARVDVSVDVASIKAVDQHGSRPRTTDFMDRLDELAEAVAVLRPVRRDAIVFALLVGCRSGELKRARVEDLDVGGRTLHCAETKNGKPHTYRLSSHAVEVALRASMLSRTGLLFDGCSDLRVRSLPDWYPHASRKIWASCAVASNVHPAAIKRLGNWTSSDVVERHYGSNLSGDVLAAEAQRVADLIVGRMSVRSRAILGLRLVGPSALTVVEGGLGQAEKARTA